MVATRALTAAVLLALLGFAAAAQTADADREMARLLARPLGAKEIEVLAGSYEDFLAYYTSAPTEASKLLKVGAFQADASLSPSQFAALTMLANEMLNMDETLVK